MPPMSLIRRLGLCAQASPFAPGGGVERDGDSPVGRGTLVKIEWNAEVDWIRREHGRVGVPVEDVRLARHQENLALARKSRSSGEKGEAEYQTNPAHVGRSKKRGFAE